MCDPPTSEENDEILLTLEIEESIVSKIILAAEKGQQTKEEFIISVIKASVEEENDSQG